MIRCADKVAGFALAALLDGDRNAEGVVEHVPRAFGDAVRACLEEIGHEPGKRDALAVLIRRLRPEPYSRDALPEAARLLLDASPKRRNPRATPAVDADLLAMLTRLAARLSRTEPS